MEEAELKKEVPDFEVNIVEFQKFLTENVSASN